MFGGVKQRLPELPSYSSVLIPIVLVYAFGAFGAVCLSSTHVYLMEQAVCRNYFELIEPARVGSNGMVNEEMCKIPEIQSVVARIHGVYNFLTFIPALLLTGPYGKIAEILGKKTILILNVSSFAISATYFTAVCYYYTLFDIRWIYLTPFFDVIGGGSVILFSFIYSYISESVPAENLSGIFYKLTTIQLIVAFLAMSLSSVLLRSNVWLQCSIGIISLLLMLPVTLLFPSDTPRLPPPQPYLQIPTTETQSLPTTPLLSPFPSLEKHTKPKILPTICTALKGNFQHTFQLFTQILYSSQLSRFTLLTYFFLVIGTGVRVIFPQWTSITFNFIYAEVNALASYEMIVSAVLLLGLPFVAKRFFKNGNGNADGGGVDGRVGEGVGERDLKIVKGSIGALVVGICMMGLSNTRAWYIIGVTIQTLGVGLNDSLRGFVTGVMKSVYSSSVSSEGQGGSGEEERAEGNAEIAKLYMGIGMVETVGGMLGTVAWTSLFARVVGSEYWTRRLPFAGGASVMVVVFALVISLGRLGRRLRMERFSGNGV